MSYIKEKKRQYNLAYRLRKLGVACRSSEKTLYTDIGTTINKKQGHCIKLLRDNHNFCQQLQIPLE